MRYFSRYLQTIPNYAGLAEISRKITITGLAQFAIQGMTIVSGILIIRILPTSEYALYTLVNTMLGTMIAVGDGGMSAAVLAEGGKVWKDRTKLGNVMATAYALRKQFILIVLLLSFPILIMTLQSHGSGWKYSFVLSISLIPLFVTTLQGHIIEIVPKLHQEIGRLQKIQLQTGFFRLFFLTSTIFFAPFTFVVMIISSVSQIWSNKKINKINEQLLSGVGDFDDTIKTAIISKVKRSFPSSVYYAFSSQVLIWLAATFGSTIAVAQLGAISRFGLLLVVFSTLFSIIFVPRFARQECVANVLKQQFIRLISCLLILSMGIVYITYLFPDEILWFLGSNYASLETELLLMIIGASLNLITGSIISLNLSRGWILSPFITISINVLIIVTGMLIFDVTNVMGILFLNIFQSVIGLIIHFFYGLRRINSI